MLIKSGNTITRTHDFPTDRIYWLVFDDETVYVSVYGEDEARNTVSVRMFSDYDSLQDYVEKNYHNKKLRLVECQPMAVNASVSITISSPKPTRG